jgi:hypothetical protein
MNAKMKRATKKTQEDDKELSVPFEHDLGLIKEFVRDKEARAALMKDREGTNIPMTIRISVEAMAILAHIAERWKENKSGLAAELLEQTLFQLIYAVYPKKTQSEIREFVLNLMGELMKKRQREKAKQ